MIVVSGSVQLQGKREKPERAEYYDRRDQPPEIDAQLFSLPPRPHHIKPWHHISATGCQTNVVGSLPQQIANCLGPAERKSRPLTGCSTTRTLGSHAEVRVMHRRYGLRWSAQGDFRCSFAPKDI